MEFDLPDMMMRHLPAGTTGHLIGGTYSMAAHAQFGTNNSVQKYAIRFRSFPDQECFFNSEIPLGSMNPSLFGVQDNKLVLLLISFIGQESMYPAAVWVPDGGPGMFLVEQNTYWLNQWLVGKAEKTKQLKQLGTSVVVGMALHSVPLVGGLLARQYGKKLADKYNTDADNFDRLDNISTPHLMRDFGHWVQEQGLFNKAFQSSYLASQGITPGTGDRL